MLYINIKRVMRLRGVENKNKFLVDLGFAPATARKLLGPGARRMDFMHLERLCLALNCTPNDLLEWRPEDAQAADAERALIKLKRDREEDLPKLLHSLPMEKFEQIAEILQDLKN